MHRRICVCTANTPTHYVNNLELHSETIWGGSLRVCRDWITYLKSSLVSILQTRVSSRLANVVLASMSC